MKSITHTIWVPCQISSNKEVKGQDGVFPRWQFALTFWSNFNSWRPSAISTWDSKCLLATPWCSTQHPGGYASASIGIFSGGELEFCMMPDALVSWYFFLCFTRISIHEVILLFHLIFNEEKSQEKCSIKLYNLLKWLLSYQHVTPKIILRSFLAAECSITTFSTVYSNLHLRQRVNSSENVLHKSERYFLWLNRWTHVAFSYLL